MSQRFFLPAHVSHWVILLAASVVLTLFLEALHTPAALLVGPIFAGAALGLRGSKLRFARAPRAAAQAVTGMLVATSLRPDTLSTLAHIWPFAIAVLAIVMICAMIAGACVGHFARIDREEAIWGFLPGMASAVIAMSDERGLDARLVAVVQLVRLMIVILGTATLAGLIGADAGQTDAHSGPEGSYLLSLALLCLGPLADRYLRMIPAGSMLLPLTIAALSEMAGMPPAVPHELLMVAYLVIGANVGLGFDRALLSHARRALPVIFIAGLALYAVGAALGLVLAWMTGIGPLTALLATVPGSIDAIAAIAYSEGADVSVVMSLQIMRLFVVVLAGPPMAQLAARMVLRHR